MNERSNDEVDIDELNVVQLCESISGDGGRERYMRNMDKMFNAKPYVLKDNR